MQASNRSSQTQQDAQPQPLRRVLLVIDDATRRGLLATHLCHAGYEVAETESTAEALKKYHVQNPDFVVSDWVGPQISGLDLCRRVRALDRDKYGYFILLSSYSNCSDIMAGLAAGADDFLASRTPGPELVARLNVGARFLRIEEELRSSNYRLRATLEQLSEAQEAMDRDLREARKLQQGLVRERSGRFGQHELSLLLRPAESPRVRRRPKASFHATISSTSPCA